MAPDWLGDIRSHQKLSPVMARVTSLDCLSLCYAANAELNVLSSELIALIILFLLRYDILFH